MSKASFCLAFRVCLSFFVVFCFVSLATATSTLGKVQHVSAEEILKRKILITWKKTDSAKTYQVKLYHQTEHETWELVQTISEIEKTKKTIKNLEPDHTYRVKVRAKRKSMYGKWSNYLTFKTSNGEGGCVYDQSPEFTADITHLSQIADIVPPPSLSGTILKTHSFINTELNTVPVYAPMDAELLTGAYYLESNPDGEYVLRFQATCEIQFMFDHITDPKDKIRAVFADEPKDDTTDEYPTSPVSLQAGELIGYTTGTQYGIWDFGVYNSEIQNGLVDDDQAGERDKTAVCPYDFYSADQRSAYYNLFSRSSERNYPGVEDFCVLEAWEN